MKRLAGEHALVTGANRGIGAAVTRALAAEGATITMLVRDAASAAPVADALRVAGTRVGVVTADITDGNALRRACDAAVAGLGPVTILVNNAGGSASLPFLKSEAALFSQMISQHLLAPVHTMQSVLPAMLARGAGRIVNIASIAGLEAAPYIAAYASAKHAMVGLTRALAAEYREKGVCVNAVCPGYTDTDLVSGAVGRVSTKTGRTPEESLRAILDAAGQANLVTTAEVAAAVLEFSDPANRATGETRVLMRRSA